MSWSFGAKGAPEDVREKAHAEAIRVNSYLVGPEQEIAINIFNAIEIALTNWPSTEYQVEITAWGSQTTSGNIVQCNSANLQITPVHNSMFPIKMPDGSIAAG